MLKSNRRSNGKEDVTQIKTSICNILTVTNENKDKKAIKPKKNRTKGYTILIPKILPKLNFLVILQLNSI